MAHCLAPVTREFDDHVLTERFYEAFGLGTDPAAALARAQRALRAAPATAHPFYWTGFVALGGAR